MENLQYGNHNIILDSTQSKKMNKAIKNETGLEIELTKKTIKIKLGGRFPCCWNWGSSSSVANTVIDAKDKKRKLKESGNGKNSQINR